NWKARVSGYEELAQLFPTFEDKEFNKYSPLVKKFVIDSNAAALEKGLAAILPFVDYCPNAGKYVESIVAGLVTKCLNSSRAKTKELAQEIVLMCVEIEKQDVVLEELIKGLEQKTPKNVAAVIRMISKCLNQFGSKVIAIKPIVPSLSKLLEDRDPTVREDTKQLTIEIYRWVKDALLPQLSNLKPILLESLKSEFENVKATKATPERLLRSQQQREDVMDGATQSTENQTGNEGDVVDEEIDPFELMQAVDIIPKLPGNFYNLLEQKIWQERKEALEQLQQLLEANPKLVSTSDYTELLKHLKRIISKDTNIVVATLAIKCLSMLATGLRKGFDKHANSCIPVLLGKFKEKKANVVQALREAIDAVYVSTNLEAIHEDLVEALNNKNPSIRSETALFLARSFSKTNPALVNKKLLKTLVTSLLKTLGDSDPTVRESSAESLGTAAKAQGDRNMAPLLQGLDQLKMTKIDEYKAKVEVKKFASMPIPAAPAVPAPKARPVPKKTGGARVVKPPISTASSQESLDLGEPPKAPEPTRKIPNKFGTVKSRLDTGSARSTVSDSGHSKLATNKRPGTVPGSRLTKPVASSSSAKKVEDPLASAPMMLPNVRAKDQRASDEKALKVLKWNFTSPREEFYTQLKEQMTAAEWNPILIRHAFHSDFKFHIKAIDQIREYFQSNCDVECVVANIDLILKWIALRFFDTNPAVIMKALELLLVMFKILENNRYSMTDLEANSFFPYLVLKVGDPKDVVRNKTKEILLNLRALYPVNKIFSHLFTGLQSKNARQRASCLEEMSSLIEFRGMTIFQAPNSISLMKDIAKLLSERDNGVRNGALSCIVQVYCYEGEKVLKMVGNLSDKEMSLIEERIKRANKTVKNVNASETANIPSSALPNLGGGIPKSRFGSTPRLLPISSTSNLESDSSEGTKIGSVSNLLTRMNLEEASNGGGSPYDTYSKSRGSLGGRSLSGIGLGRKNHSTLGFMPRNISNNNNVTTPSRLDNDNRSTTTTSSSLVTNSETSETESIELHQVNGSSTVFSELSSPTTINNIGVRQESDSDRIVAQINKDDELSKRRKEALSLSELDPKLIERVKLKYSPNKRNSIGTPSSTIGSPSNASMRQHSLSFNHELNGKFVQLFSDLSSTEMEVVFPALDNLGYSVKQYEQFSAYLEPKVDQLIALINKQLRLFLTKYYPSEGKEDERKQANAFFSSIIALLVKSLRSPLGKRISRDTLRELVTHLLPYFPEMRENKEIFGYVNYVINELIKGSDVTNLISALIRMLHDYVGSAVDAEPSSKLETYKDLTMKFIWKLVKFFDEKSLELDCDIVLLEAHHFFKSYPKIWWRDRNEMPNRTIKTLIYLMVKKRGHEILSNFTLIDNKGDSELLYYVQKSLRQYENSLASEKSHENSPGSVISTISETVENSSPTSNNRTPLSQRNKLTNGNDSIENRRLTTTMNGSKLPGQFNYSPLKMVQVNSTDGRILPQIMTSDDMRTYCQVLSRETNIQFDYDKIASNATKVTSIAEAKHLVDQARERLEKVKNESATQSNIRSKLSTPKAQ
ncbi:hypothetical protein BLOT_014064, partial [Blomia tropicalis]